MTQLLSSLRGRTLLVMFCAVVITQVITSVGYYSVRDRFMISTTITLVSRYVHLLQAAMAGLPKESHAALLATMPDRSGMRIYQGDAPPIGSDISTSFTRELAEKLKSELGPGAVVLFVAREDGVRNLSVGFQAGGEQWWLVVDGPITPQWNRVITISAMFIAVLVLSTLLVCNMTRPLRLLCEAVGAFAEGRAKPVAPGGPREIRELAKGFNGMLNQKEASDRERNLMLAGLPHDLRTPISRLKVRTELIDDEDAKDGFRRDVQDIEHIAEQFVQYLRGFGASQSNREPINLAALVDERVRRWVSAGHDVCVSVSPNSPVMSGDSVALSRVVDNLIGNAIQHGAPPIELEITAGESGRVSLVVRDHGSGIPDAEQPHALEPFTKVSQARGSKGSVGLGLAIVARVVRSHGGDLQLRNRENEGFEVQVTFAPATSPT